MGYSKKLILRSKFVALHAYIKMRKISNKELNTKRDET